MCHFFYLIQSVHVQVAWLIKWVIISFFICIPHFLSSLFLCYLLNSFHLSVRMLLLSIVYSANIYILYYIYTYTTQIMFVTLHTSDFFSFCILFDCPIIKTVVLGLSLCFFLHFYYVYVSSLSLTLGGSSVELLHHIWNVLVFTHRHMVEVSFSKLYRRQDTTYVNAACNSMTVVAHSDRTKDVATEQSEY